MNYFIIIFFVVLLFCVIRIASKKKVNEEFSQYPVTSYTIKPTKKQNVKDEKLIFSRPNKCFSCERELINKGAIKQINYGFPGKCFSCEKESKNPYFEGPTKCFSCE